MSSADSTMAHAIQESDDATSQPVAALIARPRRRAGNGSGHAGRAGRRGRGPRVNVWAVGVIISGGQHWQSPPTDCWLRSEGKAQCGSVVKHACAACVR
jgi:hypothetical protein